MQSSAKAPILRPKTSFSNPEVMLLRKRGVSKKGRSTYQPWIPVSRDSMSTGHVLNLNFAMMGKKPMPGLPALLNVVVLHDFIIPQPISTRSLSAETFASPSLMLKLLQVVKNFPLSRLHMYGSAEGGEGGEGAGGEGVGGAGKASGGAEGFSTGSGSLLHCVSETQGQFSNSLGHSNSRKLSSRLPSPGKSLHGKGKVLGGRRISSWPRLLREEACILRLLLLPTAPCRLNKRPIVSG